MGMRGLPSLLFVVTLTSCVTSPIWQAAHNGDDKRLTQYLNNGGEVEARAPGTNATLLTTAACAGQLEAVKLLIERGANINVPNNRGTTSLSCAAAGGRFPVVRYLVEKGADSSVIDADGNDFLGHSFNSGNEELAEYALAVVKEPSKKMLSVALTNAVFRNIKVTLAGALIDRGADVEFQNPGGATALHWAVGAGNPAMVRMLLQAGADTETTDKNGAAAMQMAEFTKRPDIIEIIREARRVRTPGKAPGVVAFAPATPLVDPHSSLVPNFNAPQDENAYAVIVGVEKYPDLPAATYAERDANAAKRFIRALGVPERNTMLLTGARATKTGMEKTLEAWLPNNVSEKSRVYVYYSGHGAPDVKTGDAYLVPSDGDPQYLAQTGYSLKRLYAKLGQLKAKSVIVALDSCFSGAGGRSVLAKGTRPLVGKVDLSVQAEGKISVISASAGDQISGSNEDAGYGLFTYNFLQGLNGAAKDAKGQVTLQSLYGYLKPRVQDDARRGNREQTPQLQSGGEDMILRAK